MKLQTRILSVVISCSLLVVLGCGSGEDRRPVAKVHGKVTYNGKPLQIGSLLFVPKGGGPSAEANIDRDGNYWMGTYALADGAVLGQHQVMITAFTSSGGSGLPEDTVKANAAPVSVIPEKFADLAKPGLEIDVKEGDNNVDFVLTAKAGEVKINQ